VIFAIAVAVLLFLGWSRRRLSEYVEESKRRQFLMGEQQENAQLTPPSRIAFPFPSQPPTQQPSQAPQTQQENHPWGSNEPEQEHEELSEEEQTRVEDALKKKSSLFSTLMTVFILIVAAINFFMKSKEDLEPPVRPEPPQPQQQATPEPTPTPLQQPTQDETRANTSANTSAKHFTVEEVNRLEAEQERQRALEGPSENDGPKESTPSPATLQDIQLSFSQHFSLVKGDLPYSSSPYSNQTTDTAPQSVHQLPRFQGQGQRYGEFHWGSQGNTSYPFVFDLQGNATDKNTLYIDLNQNGDLSDDGAPLRNTGSGVFAAALHLPSQQLFHRYQGLSQFEIWIFINEAQYQRGYVGHYSRTQAKASIEIDGETYRVQIVDRGNNDADFRNDGVYIDANQDGSMDTKGEYVSPGEAIFIGGRPTRFHISE